MTYLGHLDYPATDELFRQSDCTTTAVSAPGRIAVTALGNGVLHCARPTKFTRQGVGVLLSTWPRVAAVTAQPG